ncbi:MAG: TonB-dependent receptor plug [Ferruginibacter sp.]|nr:TonB-dependent receptor plug [Ferruginibacter sp.]
MLCIISISVLHTYGQENLRLLIKNAETNLPLAGATAYIAAINKTAVADSNGVIVLTNLPAGNYSLLLSFTGMGEQEINLSVPQPSNEPYLVTMQAAEEEEEEVIVSATRMSRSIADIPTRVETISGEEITEKGNMKPGEIRMMLNESTGIQTQQTSATSNNSSIRIQGLDGRYTQILKDGFPMYAGFSGGLSLMQIAPLDLKQVEVIKGSSSTLYGGGAIAGLVNLVSKVPGAKRELSFVTNITSALGLDLSAFYSEKYTTTGLTVFASRNTGKAYDPAGIGLTAIPEFERYTINPKLFVYGKKTNANIGLSFISEDRTGGSMEYINNNTPGYFETNETKRVTGQLDLQHQLSANNTLNLKSSLSDFNRQIAIPGYLFEGRQRSSYTELNFTAKKARSFWIGGVNFLTDLFKEKRHGSASLRDYDNQTIGAFVQNTWNPVSRFSLETGLRADHTNPYGWSLLPRVAAMLKASPKLTIRLGAGLGYKTPTLFNEDAEKVQFQQVLPVNEQLLNNERSAGSNLDVNFRTKIGEVGFALNQLFFFTQLDQPLVLAATSSGSSEFVNATGHIDTRGMETNMRFSYDHFKLFIGYTYADVNTHFDGKKEWLPLTARHRLNNVLMYEIENKIKIGVEAYYFSPQKLNDGARGKAYWLSGMMAEKLWNKFSLFVNFENIFDTRQTNFDTIYTGTISNPQFRDIYAPVDGFVVNGGLKIRL